MSLSMIRATFRCDGCDGEFRDDLDPAHKVNADVFQTLFDAAKDYVRGGSTSDGDSCSVQVDMHLCGACTRIADSIGEEEHVPTREEIVAKLGGSHDR